MRDNTVFQFYIFWQKDDSVYIKKLGKVSVFELYKLKIFVRIIQDNTLDNNTLQTAKLEAKLEYLTMGIRNIKASVHALEKFVLTIGKE